MKSKVKIQGFSEVRIAGFFLCFPVGKGADTDFLEIRHIIGKAKEQNNVLFNKEYGYNRL
jgi:hypothetical protein